MLKLMDGDDGQFIFDAVGDANTTLYSKTVRKKRNIESEVSVLLVNQACLCE